MFGISNKKKEMATQSNHEVGETYLKDVSSFYKHHVTKVHGYSQEDRQIINDVITQIDYVIILLRKCEKIYGDSIPDEYRFDQELIAIYILTKDVIIAPTIVDPISISRIMKVGEITGQMIETYHNVSNRVPFWKRWF